MGQGSVCTWRVPLLTPLPPISYSQWGQRGGTIFPSVGFAHTESWVGTRSQNSSTSTARCSLQMTGRSSLVSAGSRPPATGGGWGEVEQGPARGNGMEVGGGDCS